MSDELGICRKEGKSTAIVTAFQELRVSERCRRVALEPSQPRRDRVSSREKELVHKLSYFEKTRTRIWYVRRPILSLSDKCLEHKAVSRLLRCPSQSERIRSYGIMTTPKAFK